MAEPNIKDIAYRTAASVFGGPVDLATMVMRPFGYKTPDEQVFGSSEYIGKKLEDVGLVSSARAPLTEFIASVAVPTPSGIAKSAALAAPMIGGMFIGKGAKTWNALSAQKAKMLADMGTDPRTIWQQTGTWKGPDGKWRQEISDEASRMTEKVHSDIMSKHYFYDPMSDALKHEQLFQAYPELRNIKTTVTAQEQPKGSFSVLRNEIEASGPSSLAQRSTALHELQHAIQQKEGFAKGGSPEMFKLPEFSSKILEDAAIIDKTMQASNLSQLEALQRFRVLFKREPEAGAFAALERVGKGNVLDVARDVAREKEKLANTPLESYRRLAGEAEARATQKRRNLTDQERMRDFPEYSYDVPINELIIRND